MASSLTLIGLVWAALSTVSAICACTGFYLPLWITGSGSGLNGTQVSFGSFRRCTTIITEDDVIWHECGRYVTFSRIPSVSWQLTTVLTGSGCGAALLVAFTALLACCCADVLNKPSAKGAGIVQGLAALLIMVGCAIYPNGWHSAEVREVCGPNADAFNLGSCSLYWSFYLLLAAVIATWVCVGLSFHASNVKRGSVRI